MYTDIPIQYVSIDVQILLDMDIVHKYQSRSINEFLNQMKVKKKHKI